MAGRDIPIEDETHKSINKWDNEPDVVSLKTSGYHFLILRGPMKNLNGYVGVKRTHPFYGLHYDRPSIYNLEAHGGITFAGKSFGENFKDGYWYFGFDAAHAYDYVPGLHENMKEIDSIVPMPDQLKSFLIEDSIFNPSSYRDIEYMTKQTEGLLLQLQEIEQKHPGRKINHINEYKRLNRVKKYKRKMTKKFGYTI